MNEAEENAAETEGTPGGLSPRAQAAIAEYRRLMSNMAGSDGVERAEDGESPETSLARYQAERPPHHSPRPAAPPPGRGD